jgi:hypothetical protein
VANRMRIMNWIQFFFLCLRESSAVRSDEFFNDRMSCVALRGRWCHIVLNIHATTEDKSNDVKGTPSARK